jgi:hypothetical protein
MNKSEQRCDRAGSDEILPLPRPPPAHGQAAGQHAEQQIEEQRAVDDPPQHIHLVPWDAVLL